MVRVLHRKFEGAGTPYVKIAELAQAYNSHAAGTGGPPLSPKAVGEIVRKSLGLHTRKSNGIYIVPQDEKVSIAALAKRYGHTDTVK